MTIVKGENMTEQADSKPIGKKGASRTIPIALGIVCILLLVGLIGAVVYYSSTIQSKNSEITDKSSQIASLDSEISSKNALISSLNTQIADNNSTISSLSSQVSSLQSQVDSLKAVQLQKVDVLWSDNHPSSGLPYVNIHGYIFNSGSQTAWAVYVTVYIYDASGTLLKTHVIQLGAIVGKDYQEFDENIEYSGGVANSLTIDLNYA